MPALKTEALYPHLQTLRRAFHRVPELAFEEVRTAEMIIAELKRLGIPHEYAGKGSGVIGRIGTDAGAPTVALRADMDALPGTETTQLPFASEHAGCMHACGHDAHMAMVLGAAALLRDSPPPGNVLLVFQPAEERGGGSRVILKSGVLDGVRAIFGGHVTHHYAVGEIMIAPGVITAQSDRFLIKVHGRGGHGARPHEAVDAVIQTLVSRETNPMHPSVITIGRVEAGSAANVIAEEAVLEGTMRTTLPDVRAHLQRGLERMCKAFGEAHNAKIELHTSEGYPPVVNTPRETELARRAVVATLGESGVAAMDYPSMGAEDFSFYLQQLPGCYVRFGARIRENEYIPLHSPAFDIDENTLKIGAAFFDQVAREALTEYRS